MYKNAFCPVSEKKVNNAVVRTHAIINVVILIALLLSPNIYLALFLLSDFLVRIINFPRLSVVGITARFIVNKFQIKGKLENAGPKLFAARIGLLFTAVIATSLILGSPATAIAFAGVLALFSFIEGAFGFCVACMIYPFVHQLFYRANRRKPNIIHQR